ncbi:MAG: tetratricopeptide repeat protein [Fimbriimonadales bacterium]
MQDKKHPTTDLRRYRGTILRAQQTLHQNRADAQTPCYLEACIGREQEIRRLQQWLNQSDAPLLTLTGVSGIGKTHLACEFLKRVKQVGVRCIYVNLTLLQAAEQIVPAIFHALNTLFPGEEVWKSLAPRIFDAGVLLVLDDFYGLLPEGALRVQELLCAAPKLKILATSQEPLNLPQEEILPLLPLPTPPREWRSGSLQTLRQNPSVAVFLSQASGHLHLTQSNAAEIAQLCANLGGHPGKLVDAGLYLRQYSWCQFYSQYRSWFGLTPKESLRPEAQHHRLYHRLREEEQRILRVLSIFPETFDCMAAAAAANRDARAIEAFLEKLHEQGFLQKASESTRVRYRIRPQMRSIVPSLKENDRAVVLQRLHSYYCHRLQPATWNEPPPITPRAWCFAERFTLQCVLDYLKEQGDVAAIAKMFQLLDSACDHRPPAMLLDWGVRYVSSKVDDSLQDCLQIACAMLMSLVYSGIYNLPSQVVEILGETDEVAAVMGRYWHNVGEGVRAYQLYMKAISHSERRRDREEVVLWCVNLAESEAVVGNLDHAQHILQDLKVRYPIYLMSSEIRSWYYYVDAYMHYQRGKFLRSRELYQDALRHGTMKCNVWRELSRVHLELRDYDKARDNAEKALRALQADFEPDMAFVHAVVSCLGDVDAVEGDYDSALENHAKAWAYWRTLEQPRWICWTLNRLAEIELLARDAGHAWRLAPAFGMSARECLDEAWQIIEPTYMNLPHRSRTLHNLGWLAWHEGRLDEAERYLNHALTIRQDYGNLYGVARTLEVLARVHFSQTRYHEASVLFHHASQIRERLHAKPYPQIKQCNLSLQRRRR